MRSTNAPPVFFAHSQLKSAVRTPPMWRYPVGEGAKRTRGFVMVGDAYHRRGSFRGAGLPAVAGVRRKYRRQEAVALYADAREHPLDALVVAVHLVLRAARFDHEEA